MSAYTDESIADFEKHETLQGLINELSEVLLPPERISVAEAAEKYFTVYNPPAYQGPYLNSAVPYLQEVMNTLESRDFTSVCLVAPAQSGKALALDTPIATPGGWSTMGELNVGDYVFDEKGLPTRIVAVSDVMHNHECYRLTFDDMTEIVADVDHKWFVRTKDGGEKVATTGELLSDYQYQMKSGKVRYRYCIPVTEALDLPEAELPVDPYLMGLWLGDGAKGKSHLTVGYDDAEFFSDRIKELGYQTKLDMDRTCVRIHVSTGSIERKDKNAQHVARPKPY